MSFIGDLLSDAVDYVSTSGVELLEILVLTIVVAGTATVVASIIGIPAGVWLARARFRGRRGVLLLVNVGMGIPPVLAGLLVLVLLWGDGPLGALDLVFTPAAMVIVQVLLATPIAIGVTLAAVSNLGFAFHEQVRALDLTRWERMRLVVREARPGVLAAVSASFGRVVSEVGAVLIVGGNIAGETRVLTTAIVQESRQARFGAAIALGVVLLIISLVVNGVITWVQTEGDGHA